MRLTTENTHTGYLSTIKQQLDDINLNVSSVVLVQDIIRGSLIEVNQVLKTGIMARQVGSLATEIVSESNYMLDLAANDPHLLLFAEDVARQLKNRGINLVSEVSSFVLREGENVLMDFDKRDLLLKKVILELQVMRALVYSLGRSMYWAKQAGLLRSLNPYQGFINQDKRKVDELLLNLKFLKN
ncbi:hypothetical protein DU508_21670 [Pedobacter chinensis]|uniref:Uncharacterized protein n=2 Tax=Pedobacter chinensis TaxID=2282421 RepID=A0A369PP07_9SPHI|nr:hypothetical protein DU508_21670 [Pedobacter chinensis]